MSTEFRLETVLRSYDSYISLVFRFCYSFCIFSVMLCRLRSIRASCLCF